MESSTINVEKARQETPGCENVLHFNNAGAALIPSPVYKAVSDYFELELNIGGYEAAQEKAHEIENFYPTIAKLIHAKPTEIAYIENATRAWDMAFYSLKFRPGEKIITSQAEYASNYIAFLQVAKHTGAKIEVIPDDATGQLSVEALKRMIDEKTKLIAITHIPTQSGLVNPVEEVGRIANEAGIFYLVDATQSVGQMPINVEKIGCDALCATGRKFLRGPRGTGFLYVKEKHLDTLEPPFLDMHAAEWTHTNAYTIRSDARKFETWETNYSNKIGLTAAVNYALDWGLENIWERISILSATFRTQLASIPSITLRDPGETKCGIVTFTSNKMEPEALKAHLKKQGINVSVSALNHARLDFEDRHLTSVVRASLHYYNTLDEIDRFCAIF